MTHKFFSVSIRYSVLFMLVCFVLTPFVSRAQEGDSTLDTGAVTTYATISNATLVDQTDDVLTLSFFLENNGPRPQFDIHYGAELIRTEGEPGAETQTIVDSYVASEVLVLAAGETVGKVVRYPLLGVPPGTYEVFLSARTSGGTMIGIAKVADVTLTNTDSVELMAESCVLRVAGESGTTYDLYQGVDIATDETLTLDCTVKNHSTENRTVIPTFATYERNVYGEEVTVTTPAQSALAIRAGAELDATFRIPQATSPQAYDTVLTLIDAVSGAVRSNDLVIHYVVQGQSASIQTVDFNKSAYAAGEQIQLDLSWTPAADTFDGARADGGTAIGSVTALSSVVDGSGAVCSDETRTLLEDFQATLMSTSVIDCIRPSAVVSLVAEDGSILDRQEIAVRDAVPVDKFSTEPSSAQTSGNPLMSLTMIVLAVALGVLLIVVTRKKKIAHIDAMKPLLVFAVAATGFFGFNVEQAAAITWTHNYSNSSGNHAVNVTVNPNKTIFAPGETITLYSHIVSASCLNGRTPIHHLRASLLSQTATISYRTVNTTSWSSSGQLTAPTVPGVYDITLTMQVLSYVSTRTIRITVAAPVPNPPTSITATCNAPGDPVSISWPSVSGATYYAFRIGSAAGTHVISNVTGTNYNTFNPVLDRLYSTWVHACNGSGCSAGVASTNFTCASPAAPASATISATSCVIPVGNSSCQGTVTWNITNAATPNVFTSRTNTIFNTNTSRTNEPITLDGNVITLSARDGLSTLAFTNVLASCAPGSSWNGAVCEVAAAVPPAPVIGLMLNRDLIRSGTSVDVTVSVTADYPSLCTVYGVESSPFTFTHNGSVADPTSEEVFTSRPLFAAQVVTVSCEPNPINGAAIGTAESRVNVIPVIEEI